MTDDGQEVAFRIEVERLARDAGSIAAGLETLRRRLEVLSGTCTAVFSGSATFIDSTTAVTIGDTCGHLDSTKAALERAASLAQTVRRAG